MGSEAATLFDSLHSLAGALIAKEGPKAAHGAVRELLLPKIDGHETRANILAKCVVNGDENRFTTYFEKGTVGGSQETENRFVVKAAGDRIVFGPASVSIIDKEGDLITGPALRKALPELLLRKNLSLQHLDIQPGTILESYVCDDGRVLKTEVREVTEEDLVEYPLLKDQGVEPGTEALFLVGKIFDDNKYSNETWEKILKGELGCYSISGQAVTESKKVDCSGFSCKVVNEISEMALSACTICKTPMNPAAGFKVIAKSGEETNVPANFSVLTKAQVNALKKDMEAELTTCVCEDGDCHCESTKTEEPCCDSCGEDKECESLSKGEGDEEVPEEGLEEAPDEDPMPLAGEGAEISAQPDPAEMMPVEQDEGAQEDETSCSGDDSGNISCEDDDDVITDEELKAGPGPGRPPDPRRYVWTVHDNGKIQAWWMSAKGEISSVSPKRVNKSLEMLGIPANYVPKGKNTTDANFTRDRSSTLDALKQSGMNMLPDGMRTPTPETFSGRQSSPNTGSTSDPTRDPLSGGRRGSEQNQKPLTHAKVGQWVWSPGVDKKTGQVRSRAYRMTPGGKKEYIYDKAAENMIQEQSKAPPQFDEPGSAGENIARIGREKLSQTAGAMGNAAAQYASTPEGAKNIVDYGSGLTGLGRVRGRRGSKPSPVGTTNEARTAGAQTARGVGAALGRLGGATLGRLATSGSAPVHGPNFDLGSGFKRLSDRLDSMNADDLLAKLAAGAPKNEGYPTDIEGAEETGLPIGTGTNPDGDKAYVGETDKMSTEPIDEEVGVDHFEKALDNVLYSYTPLGKAEEKLASIMKEDDMGGDPDAAEDEEDFAAMAAGEARPDDRADGLEDFSKADESYGDEAMGDLREAHEHMMHDLEEGDMEEVEDEAELVAHHAEDIQEMDDKLEKWASLAARALPAVGRAAAGTGRAAARGAKKVAPAAKRMGMAAGEGAASVGGARGAEAIADKLSARAAQAAPDEIADEITAACDEPVEDSEQKDAFTTARRAQSEPGPIGRVAERLGAKVTGAKVPQGRSPGWDKELMGTGKRAIQAIPNFLRDEGTTRKSDDEVDETIVREDEVQIKNADDAKAADDRKEIAEEILGDEILEKPSVSLKGDNSMQFAHTHSKVKGGAIMHLMKNGANAELAHKATFAVLGKEFVSGCTGCNAITQKHEDGHRYVECLYKAVNTGAMPFRYLEPWDDGILKKEMPDVRKATELVRQFLKGCIRPEDACPMHGQENAEDAVAEDVDEELGADMAEPVPEEVDDEIIDGQEDKIAPLVAGGLGYAAGKFMAEGDEELAIDDKVPEEVPEEAPVEAFPEEEVIEGEADKGRIGQAAGAGIGSALGGTAGAVLGGPVGAVAGSMAGGALGSRVAGGSGRGAGIGGALGPGGAMTGGAFEKPTKKAMDDHAAETLDMLRKQRVDSILNHSPASTEAVNTTQTREKE